MVRHSRRLGVLLRNLGHGCGLLIVALRRRWIGLEAWAKTFEVANGTENDEKNNTSNCTTYYDYDHLIGIGETAERR